MMRKKTSPVRATAASSEVNTAIDALQIASQISDARQRRLRGRFIANVLRYESIRAAHWAAFQPINHFRYQRKG